MTFSSIFFPEGFVLLWKRGKDIITVGEQMIEKDARYTLEKEENGNSLVINNAVEADQGNFTCQISTYNPTELLHTVRIRGRNEMFSSLRNP